MVAKHHLFAKQDFSFHALRPVGVAFGSETLLKVWSEGTDCGFTILFVLLSDIPAFYIRLYGAKSSDWFPTGVYHLRVFFVISQSIAVNYL
jgi:hypothetical protein